jgi:asparagine synthase (glutamine-hydrolysing)
MCGIAGLYSFNGDCREQQIVAELTELLHHRGPDGSGLESAGHVAFGHRRLSIIDIAGGSQPLWSHDKNYLITFNGEIYNYIELKKELEFIGHRFTTNSDTEVIVELYRRWGVDAFKKLNGQFAFGLYDVTRRALFLARDLIGEKPLYYSVNNDFLAFASEVKSLVRYKRIVGESLELSGSALSDYLALNYIPGKETAVKGVLKLTPGHYLQVANGKVSEHKFLEITAKADFQSDALPQILKSSVSLRLRSDVPVGIFLSGGIDSALIASYVAELAGSKIKAFSADFREPSFSEITQSQALARRLGIESEVIEIDIEKVDLPSLIRELAFHGDEPLADSSALPVYLLSKATSEQVKVVLSGDGGDELFGGYLTYKATHLADCIPGSVRKLLSGLSNIPYWIPAKNTKVSWQEKLNRFLRNLDLSPAAAHFAWNGMFRRAEKARLLGDRYKGTVDETFTNLAARYIPDGRVSQAALMRADELSYLPNDILAKVDRMSMAHGLEVRAAYLDPQIIQFSRTGANLQPDLFTDKKILKDLFTERIGGQLLPQQKLGFSIPIHAWFRGRLRDFFSDLIMTRSFKESGIFDLPEIVSLFNRHLKGEGNYGFELWGVMILSIWYDMVFRSSLSR